MGFFSRVDEISVKKFQNDGEQNRNDTFQSDGKHKRTDIILVLFIFETIILLVVLVWVLVLCIFKRKEMLIFWRDVIQSKSKCYLICLLTPVEIVFKHPCCPYCNWGNMIVVLLYIQHQKNTCISCFASTNQRKPQMRKNINFSDLTLRSKYLQKKSTYILKCNGIPLLLFLITASVRCLQ